MQKDSSDSSESEINTTNKMELESISSKVKPETNEAKDAAVKKGLSSDFFEIEEERVEVDVQSAEEYQDEIFKNLLMEEERSFSKIKDSYFLNQHKISPKMRAVLFDWLMDVNLNFGFSEETLVLAYTLIDRYLSIKAVEIEELQLVGIACLLLSSKQNEIIFRRIKEFSFVSNNTYSVKQIKKCEHDVICALNFDILTPTALSFFELLSTYLGFRQEPDKFNLGLLLLQSFLMSQKSLYFSPSSIACSCCYIVMKLFNMPNYTRCYDVSLFNKKPVENFESKVNLVYNNLIKDIAKLICSQIDSLQKMGLEANFKKFSKEKYGSVSQFLVEF